MTPQRSNCEVRVVGSAEVPPSQRSAWAWLWQRLLGERSQKSASPEAGSLRRSGGRPENDPPNLSEPTANP
jgi:hypothetical protein